MKVKSATYIKSFTDINHFDLPALPAIAFIGRSNVGKSSLINSLLSRKNLVKTSATPGKTQLLNFFNINEAYYFVDLPGYGFAKVPEKVRSTWKNMMEVFFFQCPSLKLVIQILDIRHTPTNQDISLRRLLAKTEVPYCAIANKADKLKRNQIHKAIKVIEQSLDLATPPLPHSLPGKTGKEKIWEVIDAALGLDKEFQNDAGSAE